MPRNSALAAGFLGGVNAGIDSSQARVDKTNSLNQQMQFKFLMLY